MNWGDEFYFFSANSRFWFPWILSKGEISREVSGWFMAVGHLILQRLRRVRRRMTNVFFPHGILMSVCVLSCFNCVWLFSAPWTVAYQAPLSMGFSRQGYWSGMPFPSPGDLPDPGIEFECLMSPALGGRFFKISATWEAPFWCLWERDYVGKGLWELAFNLGANQIALDWPWAWAVEHTLSCVGSDRHISIVLGSF